MLGPAGNSTVQIGTVWRALRELRDEGLPEFRRGRGITVARTPQQGAIVKQARDLVRLARHHGYDVEELVRMVQAVG